MLRTMISDYRSNSASGFLTVLYLWNYRIGNKLLSCRRKGIFWVYPVYVVFLILHRCFSVLFGAFLPFSCSLGQRVVFPHGLYGVFFSGRSVVGDDCVILHHVTIGSSFNDEGEIKGAPLLGRDCFVGVGAKIIGKVVIGDSCKVGANALVTKDVADGATCFGAQASVVVRQVARGEE